MTNRPLPAAAERGFTLIEALITVAVIGILILITIPAMLGMLNRMQLTGVSRETATLMQVARLEAIKMSAPVEVRYDSTQNRLIAFLDFDRDGIRNGADRLLSAEVRLPRRVQFRGPGDAAPNGANAVDGWDDAPAKPGPTFLPDGSVDRVGAFRFMDSGGQIIEVRVETPATGRIAMKKWDSVLSKFYAQKEENREWIWFDSGTRPIS
ncbi:MAG: GspH/FimT family pseudopilin [Thermoanaerobaculia bacterium]